MPRQTMILFGDTLAPTDLAPVAGMAHHLDDPDREAWLAHNLKPFRLVLDVGTSRTRPRFFINYRNDNGGRPAHMLHEELTANRGITAFLDRQDILPGTHFPPEILEKVRGCRTLVVVICTGWENARLPDGTRRLDDENDWVRQEIREAERHKAVIVPIIVGVRPKLEDKDLPEDIRFLVDRQFVHIREGFDERDIQIAVDRLLQ